MEVISTITHTHTLSYVTMLCVSARSYCHARLTILVAVSIKVVFLYGPPANCYVAYTVIRRKIVFICIGSV